MPLAGGGGGPLPPPLPLPPPGRAPASGGERVHRRLAALLEHYAPGQLPHAAAVLARFQGHEEELLCSMASALGAEPGTPGGPPSVLDLPLQSGWEERRGQGGSLYYRHADGRKQWMRPAVGRAPPPVGALPAPEPGSSWPAVSPRRGRPAPPQPQPQPGAARAVDALFGAASLRGGSPPRRGSPGPHAPPHAAPGYAPTGAPAPLPGTDPIFASLKQEARRWSQFSRLSQSPQRERGTPHRRIRCGGGRPAAAGRQDPAYLAVLSDDSAAEEAEFLAGLSDASEDRGGCRAQPRPAVVSPRFMRDGDRTHLVMTPRQPGAQRATLKNVLHALVELVWIEEDTATAEDRAVELLRNRVDLGDSMGEGDMERMQSVAGLVDALTAALKTGDFKNIAVSRTGAQSPFEDPDLPSQEMQDESEVQPERLPQDVLIDQLFMEVPQEDMMGEELRTEGVEASGASPLESGPLDEELDDLAEDDDSDEPMLRPAWSWRPAKEEQEACIPGREMSMVEFDTESEGEDSPVPVASPGDSGDESEGEVERVAPASKRCTAIENDNDVLDIDDL